MCIEYLLLSGELFFLDKIVLLLIAVSQIIYESRDRAFPKCNPGQFFSTLAMDIFQDLSIIPRY